MGAGTVAVMFSTSGVASIFDAWFSVIPVIANNSMPIRQTAELIQCHWCNVRSQKPRRCCGRAGEAEGDNGFLDADEAGGSLHHR